MQVIKVDDLKLAIQAMKDGCYHVSDKILLEAVEDVVNAQQVFESVSIHAYNQVRWERDIAMMQLEEHGIPFGGIAKNILNN